MKFGRSSEKRGGNGRQRGARQEEQKADQRGQRKGKPSPGRRPRPELEVRVEELEPAEKRCRCPDCHLPYRRHGAETSALHEIEVKPPEAGRKVHPLPPGVSATARCACARRRGRRCPCRCRAYSGARLSVWSWNLVQVYALQRPQRTAARELGLPAGTLAGHQQDFLWLCQPLEQETAWLQQDSAQVHGDETRWSVHVPGGAGRQSVLPAVGVPDGGPWNSLAMICAKWPAHC